MSTVACTDLCTRLLRTAGKHETRRDAKPGTPDVCEANATTGDHTRHRRLGEDAGHLAVRLQVGLDILLHGERDIGVTDPRAERLQSILALHPAVA